MIKAEKLKSLKTDSFLKKTSLLISSALTGHTTINEEYLAVIFDRLITEYGETEQITNIERRTKNEGLLVLKDFIDIKTGRIEPDFDFINDSGELDKSKRIVKERYLVLDSIRSPYNLGAIARSAESLMIKELILFNPLAHPEHPRAIRTSLNTLSILKTIKLDTKKGVDYIKSLALPIFALELGGENINTFRFPESGICIIGNEEFGISEELLDICENKVTIPLYGTKGSINVSVATGIMLNMWCSKV